MAELLEENTQLAKQSIAYISEVTLADIIMRQLCILQHTWLNSCNIRAAAPFGKAKLLGQLSGVASLSQPAKHLIPEQYVLNGILVFVSRIALTGAASFPPSILAS